MALQLEGHIYLLQLQLPITYCNCNYLLPIAIATTFNATTINL